MDGWIKLHRKIRENPVFNDMHLFRLWIICLTEATHKERDQLVGRQVVHLMPGDFVTGRFDLEDMYNRGLKPDQQKSPKTIWRWLETLENGEYLTIKTTNKFSIVSILNWHKYQGSDQENDQQMTNKRPTNDQQVTTNKNVENLENDQELKIYMDNVSMTETQYQTLVGLMGEDTAIDYMERYNVWITTRPPAERKRRSAYLSVRKWFTDDQKKKKPTPPVQPSRMTLIPLVQITEEDRRKEKERDDRLRNRNQSATGTS